MELGKPPTGGTYLGDGVYAEYEMGSIWLKVQRDDAWIAICLEPEVYCSLQQMAMRMWPKGIVNGT